MSQTTPFACIRSAVSYWAKCASGITPVWPGDDGEIWQCGVKLEALVSSVGVIGHDYIEYCRDENQIDPTKSMVPVVHGRRDILISFRATRSDNYKSGETQSWEVLECIQAFYLHPSVTQKMRQEGISLLSPQGDVRRLDFQQGDRVSFRAAMEARLRIRFALRGCGIPAIEKVSGSLDISDQIENISSEAFTTETTS